MNPEVSVCVAARNYGQYLADALRSVQRQTFANWECIVVDDASEDNTEAVVRPFLADRRFRFLRSGPLGIARAKNLAFQMTSAPLVAPLDGDDVWLPAKLERQVRLLRTAPSVGVVFTRRSMIDPEGGLLPSPRAMFRRGMIFAEILRDNFVCFSSTMLRREILDRVGVFDTQLDLGIDYDLWLRAARHYAFDFIDEVLVKYRTGHGNVSQRLADRIALVLSAMRRSLWRRGGDELISKVMQREAWGSTCRTMGFIFRDDEPWHAAVWYWRAARYDRRWGASLRALTNCVRHGLKRQLGFAGPKASTANSTCNL
jgi:glycosyltransferase involved in cell wall biosynthesis